MGTKYQFYSLPLLEIIDETDQAYTLVFPREDEAFTSFEAGQYLTLKVEIDGEEYRRAYSLCSSPQEPDDVRITIKRVEGGKVSNYLRDRLKVGDRVEVMPPMGSFLVQPEVSQQLHYVMIGGGSGITPLLSMTKAILSTEYGSRVSLWYGNRNEESIIFYEALQALQETYGSRLEVVHVLSQPGPDWTGAKGRLTEEKVFSLLSDLFMEGELRKRYFLCGPQGLMDAAERALERQAVHPGHIHREFFSAPLPDLSALTVSEEGDLSYETETESFEVSTQKIGLTIRGKRHELTVEPENSILDAAIYARLDPPYTCLAGICTSCRAMMDTGAVAMDESSGLSQEEIDQGYILTCQAHPLSDDVEIIFEED
ncbi:MAG: ferredoxin--NADP reductase [Bacteroidota bacterium]